MIIALKGASKALKDRILSNMSTRLKKRIEEGLKSAGSIDPGKVDRVRQVWAKNAQKLQKAGQLSGPKTRRSLARKLKLSKSYLAMKRSVRSTVKRPLSQLSFDEINQLFVRLNEIARKEGILELEKFEPHISEEFIKLAVRLSVDGTEPELIQSIHRNWMESLLREQKVKYLKIIEGIGSVQGGDNPRITESKLERIF